MFSAGVGLAPEGIDNAAPYFSLVLDSPWTEQPDARSWFQEWGVGRCGKAGVKAAEQAYDLLFQSVYRPGKPYLFCCSKPKFCPTVHPGDAPDPPGAYRKPNPFNLLCFHHLPGQAREQHVSTRNVEPCEHVPVSKHACRLQRLPRPRSARADGGGEHGVQLPGVSLRPGRRGAGVALDVAMHRRLAQDR